MLCLKAEVLDEQDCHHRDQASPSSTGNNGFVLPINLGSSIHRYLWKKGWSFSSADGSIGSSDLEDSIPQDKTRGEKSLYKYQLEQDVKKLRRQLQEEIDLRLALASAIENSDPTFSNSPCQLPEKAQDLLDSIAVLEISVSKLEEEMVALQYQLSQERNERRLAEYRLRHLSCHAPAFFDCSVDHLHEPFTEPCRGENAEEKMDGRQAWPATTEEQNNNYIVDDLQHPCHLSEEMIRCMRDIFLFLADPSKITSPGRIASPSSPQGHLSYSSLASFSESPIINSLARSPSVDMDNGSDVFARDSTFDPNGVTGKVDWKRNIGNYGTAVEVSWLSVGKKELEYAAMALKRFRLLLERLARVDLSCMSCNEKLAFWINIYNALIMHAYLAYGIPTSEMKLFSLIQKAAYTIGGHSFTAADIEFIILKMKPPAYRPQIALVLALQKFKASEELKKYSIDYHEPLLSFALSSGMHSSPAVRIFRPENVTELLKESMRDYIQAFVDISNKGKLLVPKLLHCFAKGIIEDSLLPEWICQFLSQEQAAMVRGCSSHQKWRLPGARGFSILPFDSRFRYLFLMEDGATIVLPEK